MVDVSRDLLIEFLDQMEGDWHQIDQEWGPTAGGLDSDIAKGFAEPIRKRREILDKEDAS